MPNTDNATNQRTKPGLIKRFLFITMFMAFTLIISIAVVFTYEEIALRQKGNKPYNFNAEYNYRIEPGNKCFIGDPELGYTSIPGRYKVIFTDPGKNVSRTTVMTNGPDSLRITRPESSTPTGRAPGLWVFGCSMTYGWSLNNEETYPWLIQKSFPEYDVRNFGVCGYGTLQSLLQFRREIGKGRKPDVVVLAYASFQNARNTFSMKRRLGVVRGERFGTLLQPYGRLTQGKLVIRMSKSVLPMKSLMEKSVFLSLLVDYYAENIEPELLDDEGVTRAIVAEMNGECKKRGIKFIVAGIYNDASTKKFLKWAGSQGISTVDIAVRLGEKGMRNTPFDSHPSAKADRVYADRLGHFLVERSIIKR